MKFLEGLDKDIEEAVKGQIRTLWTHTSTAIEGNTLTLGETDFVLREGLTVSGRPLRDHNEVLGHAKALDLMAKALDGEISQETLFSLHRAVQTELTTDIYQPVGTWKTEPNGTYLITPEGKSEFVNYSVPDDVPSLMDEWLALLNSKADAPPDDPDAALLAYSELHLSFCMIHPFADGNGRLARLLANVPVLKGGFPPITIAKESRQKYLDLMFAYTWLDGKELKPGAPLVVEGRNFTAFKEFVSGEWKPTLEIVRKAHEEQRRRIAEKNRQEGKFIAPPPKKGMRF